MHYYPFNIGDFSLHTSHLTLEEEGVYRRLLDFYYDTESPIPLETQPVIRRLRLVSHADIFDSVLCEFFTKEADGWHNTRADVELNEYHKKANVARENGKKGGRPKKNSGSKTHPVILANPDLTQTKAKQELEPLTKNQETETIYQQPVVKELSDAKASSSISSEINQRIKVVFEYWQTRFNKSKTKLTEDRKRKIRARLSTHSVDQLKEAIDGCASSRYHMGFNNDKKIYNSIDLIFRNAGKVDEFIGIYEANANQQDEYEDWVNAK